MKKREFKSRKKKNRELPLIYAGPDDQLASLDKDYLANGSSYAEKLSLMSQISLFEYQMRNNTNDLPRLLRTTACIRKP